MSRGIRSFRIRVAVPGATLRVVVVGIVWAGASVLVPFPLWQGVAVVAAVVGAAIPRSLAAWVAAACLPFGVLLTEPSPWRTVFAVLVVHAVHVLASLSLVVPARSRMALGVLVPSLHRLLVIQLLAQPVVLAVLLLVPGRSGPGDAWLAAGAAAVLVIGAAIAIRAARAADSAARRAEESPTEA